MLNFRSISIRNRLALMQVFTSVIVVSIFAGIFIATDIKDYKTRKANSVTSIAHIISANSITPLLFQDNNEAKKILTELKNTSPDIVHAVIIDSAAKIFAIYSREGASPLVISHFLNGKTAEFSGKQLFVSENIMNEKQLMGKVLLEVDLSELEAIKKSRYEMALILLLAASVLSFLIASVVQRYISRRLLYLVDKMKQVSVTGNYNTTIVDNGRDEIGTLIRVYNNLMEQVRESQHKKDEFIGIASHELKTPLTSIKGYLDLLNTMEERQPNKQFVQKASDSVAKLERLIKDLLDVSKIQSGQLQLNIKEFNIDELINETINSFQMVSESHTIVKEDGLHDELVLADRQRIEQVLINLLSNAIKYSPGENKVLVKSKRDGNHLLIQVRDYGIGIAKDELAEIFERFYRTKDSSIHISGFGLGLYICRDIITRHGGAIWATKEPKGSSFYFTLPIQQNGVTNTLTNNNN